MWPVAPTKIESASHSQWGSGWIIDPKRRLTSSGETLVATEKDGLSPLRGEVFVGWLVTLTARQSSFAYRPDCVIEVGTQVQL